MVLYNSGTLLYEGTRRILSENLDKLANMELFPSFPSGSDNDLTQRTQEAETLLKALRKVWDDHTSGLSRLCDILIPMVRVIFTASHICIEMSSGSQLH